MSLPVILVPTVTLMCHCHSYLINFHNVSLAKNVTLDKSYLNVGDNRHIRVAIDDPLMDY